MTSVGLVILISFIGSFLQSNIGFGFPILAMIFFPRIFDFSTAVTITQFIALASTGYLTVRYAKKIQIKTLLPLLITSLVVAALVTSYSINFPRQVLLLILGIILVAISLYFVVFSAAIQIRPCFRNGVVMGSLAGLGNGLFGIGGPPVALYLLPSVPGKLEYLATIQAFFFFSNCQSIAIRVFKGALSFDQLPLIPLGWLAVGLGTLFGLKLFTKIPVLLLKRVVYLFVGFSGLWISIEALIGW